MESNDILDVDFYPDENNPKIELLSINKFLILYILSFGLYGTWWMYKSWKFFKEKELSDIIPAARAIFAIFFCFALFEKILDYAKSNGYPAQYSSGVLFVGFIATNLFSRLPDPYWLLSFLGGLFFIPPVRAFNDAIINSDNYNGYFREGFNSSQMIIVIVGGIFSALVIFAIMYP